MAGTTAQAEAKPQAQSKPRTTSKAAAAKAAAQRSAEAQAEIKAAKGKQPQAQPEPAPKAPRYVPEDETVRKLAQRLAAARASGVGQAVIAKMADVMPFACWRAERQLKVTADELPKLTAALDKIEAGEVPTRQAGGGRQSATAKLNQVARLVHDNWGDLKPDLRDQLAAVVGAPKDS